MRTVLAVLVFFSVASAAHARTVLVHRDGRPWGGRIQRVVDRSLVPTPAGKIVLEVGYRGLLSGAAGQSDGSRILLAPIWPRWAFYDDLLHELGHIYDRRYLTPQTRLTIEQRILYRNDDWYLGRLPNTSSEQFADAYSYAASGKVPPTGPDTAYNLHLGPERMALLRTWLTNIPRNQNGTTT